MLGAIIGDVIGSVFERHNAKTMDFELFSERTRFTDDTVLTVAIADAILSRHSLSDASETSSFVYQTKLNEYGRRYPSAGYGGMFIDWLYSDVSEPYNSFGNGSAMRVSPIGFAFDNLDTVLEEAKLSASVTHNHKEGVKGAQAVASAIYIARTGGSKNDIKEYIEKTFEYNLNERLDDIRPTYIFDVTCQGSVPQAIIAFLESEDFEDAIRKAINIGGDSDTIACITGGLAQAFYKAIPASIVEKATMLLDSRLKGVLYAFNEQFSIEIRDVI